MIGFERFNVRMVVIQVNTTNKGVVPGIFKGENHAKKRKHRLARRREQVEEHGAGSHSDCCVIRELPMCDLSSVVHQLESVGFWLTDAFHECRRYCVDGRTLRAKPVHVMRFIFFCREEEAVMTDDAKRRHDRLHKSLTWLICQGYWEVNGYLNDLRRNGERVVTLNLQNRSPRDPPAEPKFRLGAGRIGRERDKEPGIWLTMPNLEKGDTGGIT